MYNHFHLVASAPDFSKTMTSMRKYTAHEIIKKLEEDKKEWLLNQLAYYKKRHKRESTHQVWQEGYHPQLLINEDMLIQKIDYMHHNPVKRGFVDLPEHWKYSSARNYILNDHSIIDVNVLLV